MRARYAFGGAVAELARTVPLQDGEEVLLHGAMRLRASGRLPRPVVLRLTPRRLDLLAHHAFGADRVWDLPRGSVQAVDLAGPAVRIAWISEDGPAVLQLTRWSRRAAPDRPLRDVAVVVDALSRWVGAS